MKWLLLLPVIGAVLLLLLEIGLRISIWARQRYYMWFPHWRIEFEMDRNVFPRLDPVVRFYVNGDGARGDKVPRPGKDLFRVLTVGGSAVESFYVDQEKNWPTRIQRILESPENLAALGRKRVHVGNVGRSGVDADLLMQIMPIFKRQWPRVDLIIFMVGAGDVMNWLSNKRALMRSPVEEFFKLHPENAFKLNRDSIALLRLYRIFQTRYKVMRRPNVGGSTAKARLMRANATVVLDTSPDPSPMLSAYREYFSKAVEFACQWADNVIVIPQPWFYKQDLTPEEDAQFWNGGAGDVHQTEVTTFYSHRVVCNLMGQIERISVDVTKELGGDVVEVREKIPTSVDYYYDQIHFTNLGCEIIAREVVDCILRENREKKPQTSSAVSRAS